MRNFSSWHTGLSVLLFFLVLTGCDCGKPTEPQPPADKEYPVYFRLDGNNYTNVLFKYSPQTNHLDSMNFPRNFTSFLISPDEKQIYFYPTTNAGIEVYDIKTQLLTCVLPFYSRISFSPDSQLIAFSDGTELNITSSNDLSILYHDTADIIRTIFTHDNKKLFCFKSGTPNLIILDREDNFYKSEKQIDALGGLPIPSFDGMKIFILKNLNWDVSVFEVYDFILDSVIFRNIHSPGHGFMTVSSNGKYVFFTSPGSILIGTPPSPYFMAYDVENNELLEISTFAFPFTGYDSTLGIIAQEVAVTADGNWVTAIGSADAGGLIITADIESMVVVKHKKVTEWYHSWWNLTSSLSPPQS